jgi:cytochrome P450
MSFLAAGRRPPGPKARTPLGHLPAVRRDILGFLARVAREHGDIAWFRVGPLPVILLNHPDYVAEVLLTRHREVVKGRPLRMARRLLGDGLLTSEGELHARQARIVSPALQAQRVHGYGPAISELAARLADGWRDGATVDISEEMVRLATAIAGRTMFGWRMDPSTASDIGHSLDDAIALFSRVSLPLADRLLWVPLPSNRRFARARAHLDAVIYGLIAERRRDGRDHGDLLSLLLGARDGETGGGMTDRQLRDEALTLFVTAFDTVSLAMTWTWYLLAQHPRVADDLEGELDAVLAGRPPSVEDLPRLPNTRAVLAESLRLYPPVYAIARETVLPFPVGGYQIHPGTLILMSPYLLQRDPRYFPDPERFDPGRWLGPARPPRFSYFPFGGGPRGCIGQPYALQEAALILATVARRWRMTLAPGPPVTLRPLINLRPRNGVRMVLRERRPAAGAPGGV